jgi:ectoine hydroxylase-related dioxygenase (phytanoyl-CoA dioxygenase family)
MRTLTLVGGTDRICTVTTGESPVVDTLTSDGFAVERGVVDLARCAALRSRVYHLAARGRDDPDRDVVVRYERGFPEDAPPTQRISKLYRLHRSEPEFGAVFDSTGIADVLRVVIGPDVDLFLSQVVFKLPGALGQPWHQDISIFPFEPPGPILGVWCPLTDARAPSSSLGVQPRSHLSGPLAHGRDPSHPTGGRYVALVDQAVAGEALLDLAAGDRVLLDGALVHGSTENLSSETRVAATAHFAAAGTVDRSVEVWGTNPFNDWMPWLRAGDHITSGEVGVSA